jgi:hypothetical protein
MSSIDVIQKLYVAFFNRPADVPGLALWTSELDSGSMSETQIAAAFAGSGEYQSRYNGSDPGTLIESLYQNLFGRDAALNELEFWVSRLAHGLESVDSIALALANYAQGTDATAIACKISSAEAFTSALNSPILVAGYSGDYANFTARNWLASVTDPTSLSAAIADSTLTSVVNRAANTGMLEVPGYTPPAGVELSAHTATTCMITFDLDNSQAAAAPTSANVQAGTIEVAPVAFFFYFVIASGGNQAWNSLKLAPDLLTQEVIITGASNLDLSFATSFGSDPIGISSIDASAATGNVSIDIKNVTAANTGLTIKGGSGNDTLAVSTFAATLTGGAGADTFNVAAAVAGNVSAPVITTITDASSTDKIMFYAGTAAEAFVPIQVNVSTANALTGGSVNALDLAAIADGSKTAVIKWFQYGGNTYIVEDMSSAAAFAATDFVVKLSGLIDLSTATYDMTTHSLTLA